MTIWYPVIPQCEQIFYGSVCRTAAQNFFFIDTDNTSLAIIILWPVDLYGYVVWYFNSSPVLQLVSDIKKKVTTCYLSLIFSVLQSHFISWFIHMTDVLMHAEESLGVLCSWTPPAVWVCYLNPWSRVPFLAFSWSLTADPGWNSPNTGANRTVKYENPLQFSHMGMRSHVIVCTCICVCRCVYIKRTCSQIEIFSLLRRSTYSRKPALV